MGAGAETKKGSAKIQYTCQQAIRDGLDYCWIDTCCIDKTRSAQLSEAINSMFLWYRNAKVCYAYLSDLTGGWPWSHCTEQIPDMEIDESTGLTYLASSRWFTRGWTLQELTAPQNLILFSRDWKLIGSRVKMAGEIHRITRIEPGVLGKPELLWEVSVAKRMSWAAHRETTRKEDEAYCLLGLFNINMPLLYGEGERSFIRLQEAIIRESTDHTVFAWEIRGKVMIDMNKRNVVPHHRHRAARFVAGKLQLRKSPPPDHVLERKKLQQLEERFGGELLAPSVQYFANSGDISQSVSVAFLSSHEMTSVGLRIKSPVLEKGNGYFLAILQCQKNGR